MAEASRELFITTFRELLTSGEFSDFTLTCGSDMYKVHKNIVCTRAGFFARAIKFAGKEANEGGVDLSADDAVVVKLLVQYLYEAEYDPILPTFTASNAGSRNSPQTAPHTCSNQDEWGYPHKCHWVCPHHYCGTQCNYNCAHFICDQCFTVAEDANQLLIHAQMYEIADKYDVVGLKALSMEKFRRACVKFWDHPKFAQAAYHACSSTPDDDKGLRSIVCKTLSDHMSLLLKPEVEGLMVAFNGLSFDLLMEKAKKAGWLST